MNPSTDKDKLKAQQDAANAINSQLDPGTIIGNLSGDADEQTRPAFALLGGLSLSGGSLPLNMVICPTEDSRIFRCVLTIGHGSGDGTKASTDTVDPDYASARKKAESSSAFEVDLGKNAKIGFGGYILATLSYNESSGKWTFVYVGGGFTADLDIAQEWTTNFMVGPVPAVISFKVGVNLGVDIGFAITYFGECTGNDILITVGIMAYVDAFAGIGFDAGVVAIKLGIFGRIAVGNDYKTLSAMDWNDYMSKTFKGNDTYVTGSIGLKFSCKVLLIKYEKTFASVSWGKDWSSGDFDKITAFWSDRTAGKVPTTNLGINAGGADTGNVVSSNVSMQNLGNGTLLYSISDCFVETRDYLYLDDSCWLGNSMLLMGSNEENKVDTLFSNCYPYAEPQYNSDGTMVVYLSDASSTEAEDTVASYAVLSGTKYLNRYGIDPVTYINDVLNNDSHQLGADGKLDPIYYAADEANAGTLITENRNDARTGYGDSNLTASGTSDFTVSAWIRQMTGIEKKSGEDFTNEDLANAMNGTEIYASVWNGSAWATSRLTTNNSPDMAPSVAVRGERAVVAWRQVAASDAENPLTFDTVDNLLYVVYDKSTGNWSDPVEIYNGETGSIEGISSDIDTDGNILIAYTIKTGADPDGSSDTELMYTHITKDGTRSTVRLTNNSKIDKNADVSAVDWQGKQQFIVAWYHADADGSNGDIQLRAIGGDSGLPDPNMAESASAAGATGITGNFRLSAPAQAASLYNLSIIWQEDIDCSAPFAMSVTPKNGSTVYYDADGSVVRFTGIDDYTPTMVSEGDDGTTTRYYSSSSYSSLQAVQLYSYSTGSITVVGVTAPIEMAKLEVGNTIDSFSVYNEQSGKTMHAVMQSSDYNHMDLNNPATYTKMTLQQTMKDSTVLTTDVYTAVEMTNMLTAAGTYADCDFDADAAFNDGDIISMYDMPIYFSVTNTGTENITSIKIKYGNDFNKTFTETILPGMSQTFTVYYTVPTSAITDLDDVSITANTADGSKVKYVDVNLFRPQLEIYDAVVSLAAEKSRTVSMTLNNTTDIPLKGSNCKVVVAAYALDSDRSDNEYAIVTKTYSTEHDLGLIDAGAFTSSLTLTAAQFKKLLEKQYPDLNANTSEIPSNGASIYLRAWIEDAYGNLLKTMDDAIVKTYSLVDNNDSNAVSVSTYLLAGDKIQGTDIAQVMTEVKNPSFCNTVSAEETKMSAVLRNEDGDLISGLKLVSAQNVAPEQTKYLTLSFKADDLLAGYTEDDIADAYIVYRGSEETAKDAELDCFTVSGQDVPLDELKAATPSISYVESGNTYTVTKSYSIKTRFNKDAHDTVITALPANLSDTVTIRMNSNDIVSGPAMQFANSSFGTRGGTVTVIVASDEPVTSYYAVPDGAVKESYHPFASANTARNAVELTKLAANSYIDASGNSYTEDQVVAVSQKNVKSYAIQYSSGSSTKGNTTPVQNETASVTLPGSTNTVNVEITVSGEKATITDIGSDIIEQLENTEKMTLDLSTLGEDITDVSIPKNMISNIAQSDANSLEVKMPNGTVASFDKNTLLAVASQAPGSEIELVVNCGTKAEQSLSSAQKDALTSLNTPVVLDAQCMSDGVRVTDIIGGNAAITASYPTSSPVRVWYLSETGEKQLVTSAYDGETVTFTAALFSNYVIELVGDTDHITCTKDNNCVLTLFTDLDMKGWYHNGIHFCVDHNYMSGYGNGFFGPGDAVSRAMIVQILYNMEGKPAVDEKSSFKDVPENAWYADAIAWAEDNKIVGGYGDGLFRPGDNVTREQLAAIFYGYAKYKGLDVSARNDLNVFTDGTTASTWAADMLKWATAIKLMSGKGNGLLDPKGKATRAEAATIILNMYNVVQ